MDAVASGVANVVPSVSGGGVVLGDVPRVPRVSGVPSVGGAVGGAKEGAEGRCAGGGGTSMV